MADVIIQLGANSGGTTVRIQFKKTLRAMLSIFGAAALWALSAPTPALADANGYINALDQAGLIDEGDGSPCNMVNGVCHGQFPNTSAALRTGNWVCQQVTQGQSRSAIVYSLSHGEGLMPSSYNAPIIYNAATTHLC